MMLSMMHMIPAESVPGSLLGWDCLPSTNLPLRLFSPSLGFKRGWGSKWHSAEMEILQSSIWPYKWARVNQNQNASGHKDVHTPRGDGHWREGYRGAVWNVGSSRCCGLYPSLALVREGQMWEGSELQSKNTWRMPHIPHLCYGELKNEKARVD